MSSIEKGFGDDCDAVVMEKGGLGSLAWVWSFRSQTAVARGRSSAGAAVAGTASGTFALFHEYVFD